MGLDQLGNDLANGGKSFHYIDQRRYVSSVTPNPLNRDIPSKAIYISHLKEDQFDPVEREVWQAACDVVNARM